MKWPQKKLGQVADFLLGKMLDEKKNKGEFRPYLANVNVRWGGFELGSLREMRFELHEHERYGLQFGDIVMCEGGEPGRCAIWKNQVPGMMFQKALHRIRPKAEMDVRFLYYSFLNRGKNGGFDQYCTGSTIKHLPRQNLAIVEVDVPPLTIQKQIASILSAYDDLIENNTRRIEILEEMARRLYEEWFVQLRFPGHEGVEFKESELGLIPEGWQLLRLGDCVELAYGKALKAQDRVPGDYPVYGSSGVVGTHCESLVDGPGIIVGRKGNVGSVFWSDVSFFPIDTTYYVRSDVPLSYLYFNLQRQRFLNNDAAVPGLNREQAYALPFLLPGKDLLSRFSSEWESFYGLLQRLGRANVNLRAQRDLLLPKLISGEIDVSDIPMPT
ncbi:TPA: restriction endonuclease subunit S [Pseudomonas aeruginosa]|nr:restriction endonuclease subunit S [Pseudomonas aeruginosa]HBO8945293.1 restriction endonuclease subunit S [Pseudomonas aeruginosa]HBO9283716.1 restriction endonuclease subunit S [Pseudomonas aeruginosa]